MISEKDLAEKLTPAHLQKVIPESEKDLKSGIGEVKKPVVTDNDPKLQKEYTFDFNWKDGRGKVWTGKFTNKVLSIREKQMAGVMRAKLADGLSADALDPLTVEINLMVSHLSYSLIKRPIWADDLLALENVNLLQEIYLEVASHEATFLGYIKSSAEGKE